MTGPKTTLLFLVGLILCVSATSRPLTDNLSPAVAPATIPTIGVDIWIPTPGKQYFIRTVNLLTSDTVSVTCKSKDDTIDHELLPSHEFEFGFKDNFPGTTFFSCDLKSPSRVASFVAFKTDIDFLSHCSGVHCIWQAQEDGVYLVDSQNVAVKMLDWTVGM